MSDRLEVSVIIPAYNKAAVLPETLGALAHQALPSDQFEVILVDDGSSDDTLELAALSDQSYSLQVLRQANKGAGAARITSVFGPRPAEFCSSWTPISSLRLICWPLICMLKGRSSAR